MKPTHARIADFWCRLMHKEPMWPSHGRYRCRTCGRQHRVSWNEPLPAAPRIMALPAESRSRGVLAVAAEARIQCL